MMKPHSLVVIGLIALFFAGLLTGCMPEFPTMPSIPSPPQAEPDTNQVFLDELGCFPVGCDLPHGMKELCQAYEAGTISWPGDCSDMPGEACQGLCEQEKARRGLDLPTTIIDGFQVGWMQPIQIDDHVADNIRPQFGWALTVPVVDHQGRVLLVYSAIEEGAPQYYRTWDGTTLSSPEVWRGPAGVQLRVFDSKNLLHIISMEHMGQPDQYLAHTIWDGSTFVSEPLFRDRFIQPTLLMTNLAIDGEDNLHLAFWEKSRGVREVWYTRFDQAGWSEPVCVSNTFDDSWDPSIAVGKDGRVFILWGETMEDIGVEVATGRALFTMFDGDRWMTPTSTEAGAIAVDSRGIVHRLGENIYATWDGEAWSDNVQIEYPGYATAMYHFIIDPSDNVHFVWNRYTALEEPTPDGRQLERELMYRRRNADGSWGPVASLGVWDTTPTYNEVHTMLAVDAMGVIRAATSGNFEGALRQYYLDTSAVVQDPSLLKLAVMPAQPISRQYTFPEPQIVEAVQGAGWSQVSSLDLDTEGDMASKMDIAADSGGWLHVVWQAQQGSDLEILYRNYDGLAWSEPVNLSDSDALQMNPVIAVDAVDNIHVGWIGSITGSTAVFHTFFGGERWSPPERLSRKVNWQGLSSMIPVTISVENTTRPAIAAGRSDQVAMAWEHISEGVSNAVGYTLREGSSWQPEKFPIQDYHFIYAAERADLDFDPQGNLHLSFTYSGTMESLDQGIYLKAQPFYTYYDGTSWCEPVHLLNINPDANPGDQMAFLNSIGAATVDRVYVAFPMRPFEPEYAPYQMDNENSQVYLTTWDGQSWSAPRRLDAGTAFGPTHVDLVVDAEGLAHIVWSKYDSFSQRYSIYYTTSNGDQESEIELIWQSDIMGDPFPILKPAIVVDGMGAVTIAFDVRMGGEWRSLYTSKD